MPYITTEEVREIRTKIKKEFPSKNGWKFSITNRHHMEVAVKILKGKIEFDRNCSHGQINHFWIDENYADNPEARDFLNRLLEIIREVKPEHIVDENPDYGNIPNYYITIQYGNWDKPYEQVS